MVILPKDIAKLFLKLIIYFILSAAVNSLPEIIKVGGLFESGDEMLETAFKYAVERVNTDPRLLPNSRLTPQLERVERHDSFQAARKVCDLLSEGMAAMFGPQSSEGSAAVQSTCDVLEVPHIESRWDYRTKRDNHSINLFPHPTALGKAYLDFVKAKEWKKFAIVYEESDALIRLQELLKDPFIRQRQVVVRQFLPHQEYRKLLKELGRSGIKNIVIDVPTKNVQTVLKHAQQVDMMSEYHNYFITSLDLHTVDLEDFQYGGTNITGFKLVDEDNPGYIDVLETWRNPVLRATGKEPTLTTEAALLYDATRLFSRALTDLDRGQKIHIKSLSCDTEEPWPHGISLINYMRMINVKGLTGDIKFDHHGFRSDFKLKVLELTNDGLRESGEWNIHTGLNMTTNYSRANEEIIQSLKNKTLLATTLINAPYTMLKENHQELEGNEKYEGYCIDLLKEISKILGFRFLIKEVDDHKYGEKKRPRRVEWNDQGAH